MCEHLNQEYIFNDGEFIGLRCLDCEVFLSAEDVSQLFIIFGNVYLKYFVESDDATLH